MKERGEGREWGEIKRFRGEEEEGDMFRGRKRERRENGRGKRNQRSKNVKVHLSVFVTHFPFHAKLIILIYFPPTV